MFSLLVKWPEKAVSGSSRELAQLSFLVQVEKAACVTFPLCAVKVTHWSGAVFDNRRLVQFYGHAAANALRQMQAAARKVKGAEGVSQYTLAGIIPVWCRWTQYSGTVVKTQASVAMFCNPVFAEVCTGKRINRPDNRRFFQVVKRGAVNDSIGQGGDYACTAGAERKNCFCLKDVFGEFPAGSTAALCLPSPDLPPANAGKRSRESVLL